MSVESSYIHERYNVPADIGRRVTVDGVPAVIIGHAGPYLRVRLGFPGWETEANAHPTWRVVYGDMADASARR